jgi:thiol-disulfide isomerase/thioredoxin
MRTINIIKGLTICFLSLFLSCAGNDSGAKKTGIADPPALVKESSIVLSRYDTLGFEKFGDIVNFFAPLLDSFDKLMVKAFRLKASGSLGALDSIQSIETGYHDMLRKRNRAIYEYIVTHGKDAESLHGLMYLVLDFRAPVRRVDSLFHSFPNHLQNSGEGKFLLTKIEERKRREMLVAYNPAILDLKFKTPEGRSYALNEIPTKYLLLDFWASWCAPCRYENRILVKKKDAITQKADLAIVAISLDVSPVRWQKACEEDKLNYFSFCDFKELQSPVVKELRVEKVPCNFLITKDGKILARNLWGDELIQFIASLP